MKNHKQLCNSQKAQFKTITIVLITLSAFFSPLLWRGAGGEVFAQNPKLDSLFLVLKTAKTDTTRVNAYTKICKEYISSNPDTALYFGNLGLGLAIKANYNQGMSDCYNNIGLVHYYQGNYHKAIEYYLKSLKIKEELGDKKGMSQCYNNIGIVYYYQGDYLKG